MYYACMTVALQIREVPEEVRDTLVERARNNGQSLQAYLLALIEREAARPHNLFSLNRFVNRTDGSWLTPEEQQQLRDGERAERDGRQ